MTSFYDVAATRIEIEHCDIYRDSLSNAPERVAEVIVRDAGCDEAIVTLNRASAEALAAALLAGFDDSCAECGALPGAVHDTAAHARRERAFR